MEIILIGKPTNFKSNLGFTLPSDESKLLDPNRRYMVTITDRVVYNTYVRNYARGNEKIIIRMQEENSKDVLRIVSGGLVIPY